MTFLNLNPALLLLISKILASDPHMCSVMMNIQVVYYIPDRSEAPFITWDITLQVSKIRTSIQTSKYRRLFIMLQIELMYVMNGKCTTYKEARLILVFWTCNGWWSTQQNWESSGNPWHIVVHLKYNDDDLFGYVHV